jgi:hypothetical protein
MLDVRGVLMTDPVVVTLDDTASEVGLPGLRAEEAGGAVRNKRRAGVRCPRSRVGCYQVVCPSSDSEKS